jgi:large subunit ribosomal protein L24
MKFSTKFKESVQPRKQRLYRHSAPLHIKQKFVHAHLSKELRQKYGIRSIGLKKDDKVKIMRGQFNGKTGSIESLDLKTSKAIITGIEIAKKDGSKTRYPIHASNLMITELNLNDKKRKTKLEVKKHE